MTNLPLLHPISMDQLLRAVNFVEKVNYQQWLVGAVLILALTVVVRIFFIYISLRMNREISRIVFVPAFTDANNIERVEEFFGFVDSLLKQRPLYKKLLPVQHITLEISARLQTGMQYQFYVPTHLSSAVTQGLKSIFQGAKVFEDTVITNSKDGLLCQFRLRHHPALPLRTIQKEHISDPHSFIASSMSELKSSEGITVQLVTTPLIGWRKWKLHRIDAKSFGAHQQLVENKLHSSLFATTLRVLAYSGEPNEAKNRLAAVTSALLGLNRTKTQELMIAPVWLPLFDKLVWWAFAHRFGFFSPTLVLSSEELASLVHPATGRVARAEDVSTNRSKLLPLPTALKTISPEDGVVIGSAIGSTNNYPVVLTDDDRSRHVYLLGQTGSGKSTILFHMASRDIADGHGVAVIDPHGDLIEDLISALVAKTGQEQRVILIDPSDLKFPVGINLLELPDNITDSDELDMEKELVCEGVISVFKRVFNQDEEANAHRIEYILRNVIHTAFTVPDATIFTLYDLINNPSYRKSIIQGLRDENLLAFWKNEFLKSGNWQQVKMVSGVTAKIGRFLFSPSVKRILEQPKSTIDFDSALADKRVLLCNLSEGKIGEDNSHLMGSVVITKLHLAALRRARLEQSERTPFYLYVDEFQHFATSYFTRLLSGGRKFGLRVIIAQQSTSQLSNLQMIQVILANTGTVIAFRTASSNDAELLLPLFGPLVTREDIVNLPRHHFYVKLGSNQSQPAFSGKTLAIVVEHNPIAKANLISLSREHNTRSYSPVERPAFSPVEEDKPRRRRSKVSKTDVKGSDVNQTRLA